jgi:hypothetical protein
VKTRLKGYKYFEIERDLFNKLGVLIIDKLTLLSTKLINTLIKINYSLSTFRRCQDSGGKGD